MSKVIVREQHGQRRELTLEATALPRRPTSWASQNTLVTTPNGGNPEASQQLVGPGESPSDWTFAWSTSRLLRYGSARLSEGGGAAGVIEDAWVLYEVFDDLLRSGSLLSVAWLAGEQRRIERFGMASTWSMEFDDGDDVVVHVKFEWLGRTAGQRPRVSVRGDGPDAALQAAIAAFGDLAAAASNASGFTLGATAPSFDVGDLSDLVDAPAALIADLGASATQVLARASAVASIASRARGALGLGGPEKRDLLEQLRDVGEQATRSARRIADGLTGVDPTLAAAGDGPAAVAQAARTIRRNLAAARLSEERGASLASAARARLRRASSDEPFAVARAGDTFARIAMRAYGTADVGPQLAVANHYPPQALGPPLGAVVLLPERASLPTLVP